MPTTKIILAHLQFVFSFINQFQLLSFLSDLTNGIFEGPIDGYNSLIEIDSTTPFSGSSSTSSSNSGSSSSSISGSRISEPYFDAMIQKNVTALVGKSAYLSCKVRNLGNKTVSFFLSSSFDYLVWFFFSDAYVLNTNK